MQHEKHLQKLVELGAVVSPQPNGTRLIEMARRVVVPRKKNRANFKFLLNDSGCWNFVGKYDYPDILIGAKKVKLHRLFYELFVGPLGDLQACHTCDNPRCVNPAHIFPGTQADNLKDMAQKGRAYKGGAGVPWTRTKTHCLRGHPLSGDNLSNYKKARICKACQKFHRDKKAERKGKI